MEQNPPHNLPSEFQLTKIMEMEIGNYFFYGNIVVVEAKEGINISYKKDLSIILLILNITKDKPWVYISNRINSYSIETMDYKYLNKVPTLKALGIVNHTQENYINSDLEVKFCKKPYKVFENLIDAANWGKEYL